MIKIYKHYFNVKKPQDIIFPETSKNDMKTKKSDCKNNRILLLSEWQDYLHDPEIGNVAQQKQHRCTLLLFFYGFHFIQK